MRKTNFLILIIAIVLSACLIGCDGCNGCGGGQDPVNIEEENITIKRIGDTVQLTVTGGNDEKVWSSTDTAVATVTDAGLVTAVANGIAEITVTSAETTDVCVIVVRETVIPEPGLIVTFPKTAVTLNAFMSETYTIVPTITKNNVAVEGATITWTTSDETKATINNGLVTAIANTEAGVPVVITCKAELGGEFAEAKLYVTVEDDTDITFTSTQTLFYTTDGEIPVTALAKINGADAVEPIVFSTSNIGIAKVEGGKILPVTAGDVVIYANINGKSKGYPVHIRAKYYVDSADDLKSMRNDTDDVAYELVSDITVETSDFVRASNGGTGTKNTTVYLIENYKGEFFGNGYKITYNYNCGYYGEFSNETFVGLFKMVDSTAVIKDTAFVANLRLDHPHMYSFIHKNYGKIESCYVRSNRRQVAAGTGYQAHYNTAGGVFETNDGIVTDTIIIGNFYAGEHETTSTGDNLVMAGSKNAGKFDNVAFISARTAIGNHRNANWNGSGAMGRDELTYLVRYDDMAKFIAKEGERVTNPTDDSNYTTTLYQREDCTDQELSNKWDIGTDIIKLENRNTWVKASVEANLKTVDFIPEQATTAQLTVTTDHANKEFEFKSEDPSVISVSSTGLITKVATGRTRVIATHKVSGEQKAVIVSALKPKAIATKGEFLALGNEDDLTYAYLTSDIELTMEDIVRTSVTGVNEVFVSQLKAYLDGKGHTVSIDYDSHKVEVEVEQQVDGAEEGVTETVIEEGDSNFIGVFGTVTGKIVGVAFAGNIDNIADGATVVTSTLETAGVVENCFVNVNLTQARSKGNWSSMLKVIGTNKGEVQNCIIQANSSDNNRTNGILLQSHGAGTWTNVAQIGATHGGAYYNRGNASGKIRPSQINDVVHYTNVLNFLDGVGRNWIVTQPGTASTIAYSYETITTEQTFPSVWIFDKTEYVENIKLYGIKVWERETISITNEEDFIAKMNSATDSSILKLTQNLTFDTDDLIKEDNGSTSVRNKNTYLIKSFKGVLFGEGYSITYTFKDANVADSTTCDVSMKGFIYNLEATAKLIGLKVVGEVHVPYDSQTAFVENVLGTVDNCFIDIALVMHNGKNYLTTTGVFGKMAGTVSNCVIKASGYTGGVTTGTDKGTKLLHTGQSGSNGIFKNVALIQGTKNIGTKNNANSNGYLSSDQMVNLVHYSSFANLISATGESVANENTDKTFEYTAITEAQDLGSAWTIDATGIKLNGNYVYQVPANA